MKTAIVTGSTQGIGKAIAEKLLKEGWFVFINYRSDIAAAKEFALANRNFSESFFIIKSELSSNENVQVFIDAISKKMKSMSLTWIDCIVLNAGATNRTKFDEITPKDWSYVINTNVNAPFYLVHGLKNKLNDNASIIFIGSVLGILPHSMSIAYGVTKAAIHQMAKELVKFFTPEKKITVNAIAPGFTQTQWQQSKSTELKARIENKIAMGRFAFPDEIASLCMEVINNPYINGSVLNIDGGYDYK